MTPLWALELAGLFWDAAGESEPFPRDLRRPVARALPLTVILLPDLRVAAIDEWLRWQSVPCALSAPDRPLRACLLAHDGRGAIFVDGTDPEAEQRFSLAHELAHFLRDYWQPRERAVAHYGRGVLEAMEGRRPPTAEERIHALLALVPIGFHIHLMDRRVDGSFADASIDLAERSADRLALELLAPHEDVRAACPEGAGHEETATMLQDRYGLPPGAAHLYAHLLVPAASASFVRRLWSV